MTEQSDRRRNFDWDHAIRSFVMGSKHDLWRHHSDSINREFLRERFRPGRCGVVLKTDLFDEATGPGLVSFFEEDGERVVGIDVSRFVLGHAGGRVEGLTGVGADVRDLPFEDESFDTIVSLSTLDHFETFDEIEASIGELVRALRAGGEMVLTLDNLVNPVVWLRNALPLLPLHRLGIVPYYVGRTCGPRRLKTVVADAGLEVLGVTAIMHAPRVFAVAVGRLAGQSEERRRDRVLGGFRMFEGLRRLPTRYLTGYFVAIHARKPTEA